MAISAIPRRSGGAIFLSCRRSGVSFGMLGMQLSQSLNVEQRLEIAHRLELTLYQKREELFTGLYQKAMSQGKVITYRKHGLDFEYALVSKKDVPAEIIENYGGAFSHCLYDSFEAFFLGEKRALSRGSWMRFVVEDAHPGIPKEYIEYAAVHEQGETLTLGNHLFATRLEFSIAEREGKLKPYLRWIETQAPQKISNLFRLNPEVVFPEDDMFIDEIVELTSNNPALRIIRTCPWPVYLLQILKEHMPVDKAQVYDTVAERPLWLHQTASLISLEALRRIGHKSAYLEIGTGGGKTYIAVQDIVNFRKQNPEARVLWLAHRIELLNQAREAFREIWPDAKVSRRIRGVNLEDVEVVIVSKQALERNPVDPDSFQYIVVDEAHHAPAEGYQQLLEDLEADFKLGITATPRRFSDRKHIREIFGEAAIRMNLLDLVRSDIICPVRFRKVETNVEVEAKLTADGDFSLPYFWHKIEETSRNQLVVDTYLELEEEKQGKAAITFCVGIEHAKELARLYQEQGIKSRAIHSDLTLGDRRQIIEDFRNGKLQMLTAVDILNEGVDFPPVEVVLMARPTRSKTVWLQQIGRGVRKSEATGKRDLLVIDFVDNIGGQIRQITFEDILVPRQGGTGTGPKAASTTEITADVYIENIIDMNLDEIYGIIPLQSGELTTGMLAEKLNISPSAILKATKDGRIAKFVRRKTRITGSEKALIFHQDDIGDIRTALSSLQPGELTSPMLAKRLSVSTSTIHYAIKDGRIVGFVSRKIKGGRGLIPVFHEDDIDKIRAALGSLQPGELTSTMLAKKLGLGHRGNPVLNAIKSGRISSFVRRTTKIGGQEATIFHEDDIDKIRAAFGSLQPGELTSKMLAKKVGMSQSTIYNAIIDGRIAGFIRRTTTAISGQEASIFNEDDIDEIRAVLAYLQPGELTSILLAERVIVSKYTIIRAVKDGRIARFVRRTVKVGRGEAPIFHEDDIEDIRAIFGIQSEK